MDAVLVVKASIILAATLAAAWLLRRAPAVTRHRLWTLGFAAVLALPILAVALPALYVPMPSGRLTNLPDIAAAPTRPSVSDSAAARGARARNGLDDSRGPSMAPPESGPLSIRDYNADAKVAAIEKEIAALDADRRVRQLEDRRNDELKQLAAAIAAIR